MLLGWVLSDLSVLNTQEYKVNNQVASTHNGKLHVMGTESV